MKDHLALPFATRALDTDVQVTRLDSTAAGEIVAVCGRGKTRQKIPILDLPLPQPRPEGAEWIDAYRRWRGR